MPTNLFAKFSVFFILFISFQIHALQIGDKAPNFKADSTQGELDFYNWSKNQWVILLSHPGWDRRMTH